MDPDTEYQLFEESLAIRDAAAIARHADALANHLDYGGTIPQGMIRRGFMTATVTLEYFRDVARAARAT